MRPLNYLLFATLGSCSISALLRELVLPFFGQEAITIYDGAVKTAMNKRFTEENQNNIAKELLPFAQLCFLKVKNYEEKIEILEINTAMTIFANAVCLLRLIESSTILTPHLVAGGNRLEELGRILREILSQKGKYPRQTVVSSQKIFAFFCQIQILEKPDSLLVFANTLPFVLLPKVKFGVDQRPVSRSLDVGSSDDVKWARSLLGLSRLNVSFSQISMTGVIFDFKWTTQSEGYSYLRVQQLRRYLQLLRQLGKGGIDGLERKLNTFMQTFIDSQGGNIILQSEMKKRLEYKEMPKEAIKLDNPRPVSLLPLSLVNAINRHVSKKNRIYLASLVQPIWHFVNLINPSHSAAPTDPEQLISQYNAAMQSSVQSKDKDEELVRELLQLCYSYAFLHVKLRLQTKPWPLYAPAGGDRVKYVRHLASWMNTLYAELKGRNSLRSLKENWAKEIIVSECKAVYSQNPEECILIFLKMLNPCITTTVFTQTISS